MFLILSYYSASTLTSVQNWFNLKDISIYINNLVNTQHKLIYKEIKK